MKYNYNDLLREQLYNIQNRLGISNFDFVVDSEQAFLKNEDFQPNTIYVLTKELANENQIGVDTQPVQILILTEQDSLETADKIFTEYSKYYNWKVVMTSYTEDDVTHSLWIKQQYTDPVVLSNFNTVDYGYRSVLYISANLYIMTDVVDLKNLKIDDENVQVLSFNLSYSMTPNTQQFQKTTNDFISQSVKSVSNLALTITIPVVETNYILKVLKIMDENDTETTDNNDPLSFGGNENFYFDFYLGSYHFSNKKMKLILADFGTVINDVPAIKLGFAK